MDNMTLRELQHEEAVKRIEILDLLGDVKQRFEKKCKNHNLYYAERINKQYPAVLYFLDNHPEYVQIVKTFEEKHEAVVYFATLTHMEFGDLLDLYYVGREKEEWHIDREDLEDGRALVYSIIPGDNRGDFGYIGFRKVHGALERIA